MQRSKAVQLQHCPFSISEDFSNIGLRCNRVCLFWLLPKRNFSHLSTQPRFLTFSISEHLFFSRNCCDGFMTSFSRSFWSLSFLKVTNGSRYKWLPRIKGRKWKALHLGRIYVLGSKVGIGFSQDWLSPSKLSIPSRPLFWNSSNHPDTFPGKIQKNRRMEWELAASQNNFVLIMRSARVRKFSLNSLNLRTIARDHVTKSLGPLGPSQNSVLSSKLKWLFPFHNNVNFLCVKFWIKNLVREDPTWWSSIKTICDQKDSIFQVCLIDFALSKTLYIFCHFRF